MEARGHSGSVDAYTPYGSWGWRVLAQRLSDWKGKGQENGAGADSYKMADTWKTFSNGRREGVGRHAEGRGCQIGYCQDAGDRTGGLRTGVNGPGDTH